MKLDELYMQALRSRMCSNVGNSAVSGFKRVVMVGAWLEHDTFLSGNDQKFLEISARLLRQSGHALHPEFDLAVMDMNSTGEDFKKDTPEADLVIVAHIPSDTPEARVASRMCGNSERNPFLLSDNKISWQEAVVKAGAKALVVIGEPCCDVVATDFPDFKEASVQYFGEMRELKCSLLYS